MTAYEYERGSEGPWWRRRFEGTRYVESVFCAFNGDTSVEASGQPGHDYDRRCASCWLGHGHTIELHQRRVKRAAERTQAHELAATLNDPPVA